MGAGGAPPRYVGAQPMAWCHFFCARPLRHAWGRPTADQPVCHAAAHANIAHAEKPSRACLPACEVALYDETMLRDGRWDWLEGLQQRSIEETVVREAAKAMAHELIAWPPRVRFPDEHAAAAMAAVLAEPPTEAALQLGFALAAKELRREFDARDQLLRDSAQSSHAAMGRFVATWLTEWLLELAERVQSRLSRAQLVEALPLTEAIVRRHKMG